MRPAAPLPALHLTRLPGEFGMVLRCRGGLDVATAEGLRRELALLESLNHSALILNLSHCEVRDVEGLLTVLRSFQRLRAKGRRLVVVTGALSLAARLGVVGIDQMIPNYPTEEAAALALRGWWPPLPAPDTWAEARAEAIVHWKVIQEAIDKTPREELLQLLTSMTGLCERAEALYQEDPAPNTPRCMHCPLFQRLGGRPEDVGCRSLLDPILVVVRAGAYDAAHAQVAAVIRTLEEMPLPPEDQPVSLPQ